MTLALVAPSEASRPDHGVHIAVDWRKKRQIHSLDASPRDFPLHPTYIPNTGAFLHMGCSQVLAAPREAQFQGETHIFQMQQAAKSRRSFRSIYPSGKRRHLPSIYLILKTCFGMMCTSQPPQAARLGSRPLGSHLLFFVGFAPVARRDPGAFQTQSQLCSTA